MSQFEQKYYKHYHVKSEQTPPHEESFDFFVWTRKYRVFEMIIILLLLLILLCMCFKTGPLTNSAISFPSVSSYSEGIQRPDTYVQGDGSSPTLGFKYSKKVLPPSDQLVNKGGQSISLGQYMYFAHEKEGSYPDFIDPTTNRVIEEKKPSCFTPECPATGISQEDKEAYALWVEGMTHTSYAIKNTSKGFSLTH